jgi:hypothetical protein
MVSAGASPRSRGRGMALVVGLAASPCSRCGGMALMVSLVAFSRSRCGGKEQSRGRMQNRNKPYFGGGNVLPPRRLETN